MGQLGQGSEILVLTLISLLLFHLQSLLVQGQWCFWLCFWLCTEVNYDMYGQQQNQCDPVDLLLLQHQSSIMISQVTNTIVYVSQRV